MSKSLVESLTSLREEVATLVVSDADTGTFINRFKVDWDPNDVEGQVSACAGRSRREVVVYGPYEASVPVRYYVEPDGTVTKAPDDKQPKR